MNLWQIVLRCHSLNFKALESLWAEAFKRYFLVHFVGNSAIFAFIILVQEERILIWCWFSDSCLMYWLIIYSHLLRAISALGSQLLSATKGTNSTQTFVEKSWENVECSKDDVAKKQANKEKKRLSKNFIFINNKVKVSEY